MTAVQGRFQSTPVQSSAKNRIRPQSTSLININRNYSNPSYHTYVDMAKAYQGMVDSHILLSKIDHHQLNSAQRAYYKQIMKDTIQKSQKDKQYNSTNINNSSRLKRSKSSISMRNKRKVIQIQDNKIQKNPQDADNIHMANSVLLKQQNQQNVKNRHIYSISQISYPQIREILSQKTHRVPQYSKQVQQKQHEYIHLQNMIKQLKRNIIIQQKNKEKVSLSCSKILNEREETYKKYCNKYQDNYHLNVSIQALIKENQNLKQDIVQKQIKNNDIIDKCRQQKQQCQQLQSYVKETKRQLIQQSRNVSKLKTEVTIGYNNMENNFSNLSILKSEKALLLNDVDAQHGKNK